MKKTCICKQKYEDTSGYYTFHFFQNEIYEYIEYYSNIKDVNIKRYMLYIENRPCALTPYLFDTYFIDLQKLRKIKLEKLNGIQGW